MARAVPIAAEIQNTKYQIAQWYAMQPNPSIHRTLRDEAAQRR
jgi:hypothetical protein